MATKNQIIGRGARKFSHDHLPEDQRHLKVYQLLLEYPDGRSADEIMFGHAQRKDEHCDEFLTLLKS